MNTLKLSEGDRIVLKLFSGENFEGDVVRDTSRRMEIENIHHYESGNKIDSIMCFYRTEIESVYKLKPKQSPTETESPKNDSKPPSSDHITLDREEYERLQELSENFKYIEFDDKNYFEAVNDLVNFESVGVLALSSNRGLMDRVSVIAVSTWKQIYIFDLRKFRTVKFPTELASILESYHIKKIVHDGGILKSCLETTHKVYMDNIHDTLVAHLMLEKNGKGKCPEKKINIGQCLTKYFNFPSTLLTPAMEILKEPWPEHPTNEEKRKLSKLITYLITIRDYQLSVMLEKLDEAVSNFHNLYFKSLDLEKIKRATSEDISDEIEKIIPSELLPAKKQS